MTFFLTPNELRSLRRMLHAVDVDRKGFWLSVLLGVVGMGSSIALAATSAWLIARASQLPPVLYLSVAATSVRMFGVLRALMRYLQRLASHKVALKGMDSLRFHVYSSLADARVDRVASMKRGDLLARTGADIDAVGDLVVKAILPAMITGIVSVGTVAGIALISPATGLVLALCLITSGIVAPLVTMRAARLAETNARDARVALSGSVVSFLEGASELGVNGRLDAVKRDIQAAEHAIIASTAKAARVSATAVFIDRCAMGAAVVGAMLIGIPNTFGGTIAAVLLAVIVLTPLASFEGTAEMAPAAVQLVRSAQASERIDALLGSDAPVEEHPVPVVERPRLVAKNLAVGWPGGPIVARNINLDFTVGDRLGIVGPSGVGKTTLLLTLAGMLEPREGSVTLNGVDMWAGQRDQVSAQVTMTAEDAHVFATTVLENLRVADPDLDEERAAELLRIVGLESWLATLPSGLDTLLGSGATTVSGGERRRLLMARALAAPSALLLADEASEHLDPHTADTLMRTLYSQAQIGERGIAIVTHRLSALDAADTVIVLGKPAYDSAAEVIACGRHTDLMESSESYRWAVEQERA